MVKFSTSNLQELNSRTVICKGSYTLLGTLYTETFVKIGKFKDVKYFVTISSFITQISLKIPGRVTDCVSLINW